jgi:hypothetical protein
VFKFPYRKKPFLSANELQVIEELQFYSTHGTFPSSTFLVPKYCATSHKILSTLA